MKELILISTTPIIIQIFTLITKKLNIKLEVLSEAQVDHKVDIIVVDKDFVDDRFNILKTYTKLIGAITNKELSFEVANDFTIPLPFLPSNLQTILDTQLQVITKRANTKTYITSVEQDINEIQDNNINYNNSNIEEEELDPALHYLDSLATDIAHNIDEETDDSIVSLNSLNSTGGILDTNELSKLEKIIDPDKNNFTNKKTNNLSFEQTDNDDDEWLDLSSIIDEAIYEVNSLDTPVNDNDNSIIKLSLNDYSLDELAPLLNLLNQDIIDKITNGEEILLQLKLGDSNV